MAKYDADVWLRGFVIRDTVARSMDLTVKRELEKLQTGLRGAQPAQVIMDEAARLPEWGGAMARLNVNVGDKLLTPYGIAKVLGLDIPRDGVVTDKGNWGFEEIEAMPYPNTSEVEAVELWLELAGRIIPKRDYVTGNVKCTCGCDYCTLMLVMTQTNAIVESQHFANSTACKCRAEGCACV